MTKLTYILFGGILILFLIVLVSAELGSELVTNGDFETCPGAWTDDGDWLCTGLAGDKHIQLGGRTSASGRFNQSISITSGKKYQVSLTTRLMFDPSTTIVTVTLGSNVSANLNNSATTFDFTLTPTDTSDLMIYGSKVGGNVAQVSNISVKEIISNCWTKTDNVLFIPTGCVYEVLSGEVG